MTKPKSSIYRWMKLANAAQKKALAKGARTSVQQLQHLASGRRIISADQAQRIAHAAVSIKQAKNDPLLPALLQHELCAVCGRCPLIRKN